MEIREVAPSVFACLVPDRGWGWSNCGVVASGDGLMVDTLMDVTRTRRALGLLEEASGVAPARLVNTHHNIDHCWGNQLFRDREILAHRRCAEAMRRDLSPAVVRGMLEADDLSPGLRWFADDVRDFDFSDVEPTPPNRVLDGDLELDLGGLAARILYVGPAHTAGDVIVHLPGPGVVFAGDVIFRECTPIGWEGTTGGWIGALERILALEPAVIVPGHGPLCGPEGASELVDYFRYVYEEARFHYDSGRSVEEAARRLDLGPFGRWSQPERVVFNLARAYREFRGGAEDEPIDMPALLDQAVALRRHWDA